MRLAVNQRMCSAYGCCQKDTFRARKSGITFHTFPTDEKLKRQWERAMHKKMKCDRIYWRPNDKEHALCSAHFRGSDFVQLSVWKKLKLGVIPSKFECITEHGKPLLVNCNRATTVVADSLEAALTTYFCPECNNVYKEVEQLQLHMLSAGHRYVCPKKGCEFKFLARDEVIRHLTQGHSKQNRRCEICPNFCADNALAWSQHEKENHF